MKDRSGSGRDARHDALRHFGFGFLNITFAEGEVAAGITFCD